MIPVDARPARRICAREPRTGRWWRRRACRVRIAGAWAWLTMRPGEKLAALVAGRLMPCPGLYHVRMPTTVRPHEEPSAGSWWLLDAVRVEAGPGWPRFLLGGTSCAGLAAMRFAAGEVERGAWVPVVEA